MEKLEFFYSGSSSTPYKITLEKHGSNLNVFCTCPAGKVGQICKHRMYVLSGNPLNLVNPNIEDLKRSVEWVSGTDVELALVELSKAEDAMSHAKKMHIAAKNKLIKALRN